MKRKDFKNKLRQASSTVEMAFIMPILIIITILLLYLSFFLYNRLIITQISYRSALRGSRIEDKNANDMYQEADKSSKNLIKNKLLYTDSYQKKIEVAMDTVSVSLSISTNIPFSELVMPWIGKSSWTASVKKKAKKMNPYRFIRLCRRSESDGSDL